MRMLFRNKRELWYSKLVDKKPVEREDESGNVRKTGEWETVYDPLPTHILANVSGTKGFVNDRIFGEQLDYNRVIALDYPCPIDETTRIWFDKKPVFNSYGVTETPHDYVVAGISDSLNHVLVAIRKVVVKKVVAS